MSPNPVVVRRETASHILTSAFSQGGSTILVDGYSRMGKTYFLRELADQARQHDGWTVTFVSADRIERAEPYSFIERFLAAGIAPEWDFDAEGQKQPLAVARACVRYLLGHPNQNHEGHLIIIDDAQWIDEESTRVLLHMIPRVNRRNVVIACSARTPHAALSLGQFLAEAATASPLDYHIKLDPLAEHEIRALAMGRFGMMISPQNAAELRKVTGGSFLGVDSIFNQVTREEIEQLHRTWDFPIRNIEMQSPLLGSFRELASEAQAIAQIVCLAEHKLTPETLLAATHELGIPNAIHEAMQADVIIESDFGRSIVPKHDLIASAVRRTVEPAFARQVYRALAELTTGFRSVRHMLKGAETWNGTLHRRLQEYVEAAIKLRQFHNAIEALRVGLELAQDPTVRQQLITDLALISIRTKSGSQCVDLLPELETFPHSMLRESLVLMLRVYLLDEQYPEHRVEAVLRTPTRTPDEIALQGFLLFTLIMVLMRSDDRNRVLHLIPIAKRFFAKGPQRPDQLHDPRLSWMVAPREYILMLECVEVIQWNLNGRVDDVKNTFPVLVKQAYALPDIGTKIDCLTSLAGVAMITGEVRLGHDLVSVAVELLDRGTIDAWSSATPRIILAHSLLLLGQYQKAAEALDTYEEMSHETFDLESRLTGAALRAALLSITAEPDPDVYVAQAKRIWDFRWEHYGRDLSIMAKLEIARTQGDDQLIFDLTSQPRVQEIVATQRGFLTYRAHALLNLRRYDEARELIDELEQRRGTSWHEHCGTLEWLQARLAAVTNRPRDARRLFKAATKDQTYPLPWALTCLDYGAFLMTQDEFSQAEVVLRKAVNKIEQLKAKAYLAFAEGQLDAAVKRNRQAQSDFLTDMTEREREVAALVADGHSNRSIAERLVVSQSTARFHVSNILRKLQLTSRAEVAKVFHPSAPANGGRVPSSK